MNDLLYWRGCNICFRRLTRKNQTTPAIRQVAYMALCCSLAGFFTISGLYFENQNRKYRDRGLLEILFLKFPQYASWFSKKKPSLALQTARGFINLGQLIILRLESGLYTARKGILFRTQPIRSMKTDQVYQLIFIVNLSNCLYISVIYKLGAVDYGQRCYRAMIGKAKKKVRSCHWLSAKFQM